MNNFMKKKHIAILIVALVGNMLTNATYKVYLIHG